MHETSVSVSGEHIPHVFQICGFPLREFQFKNNLGQQPWACVANKLLFSLLLGWPEGLLCLGRGRMWYPNEALWNPGSHTAACRIDLSRQESKLVSLWVCQVLKNTEQFLKEGS